MTEPRLSGGPHSDAVTLRDYFAAALQHERELREQAEKRSSEALHLQAGEYNRRLEILNGEAERLHRMQLSYVSRETYETRIEQTAQWQANVDRQLTRIQTIGTLAMIGLGLLPFILRVLGGG